MGEQLSCCTAATHQFETKEKGAKHHIINIHCRPGKKNPADVQSKHWVSPSVWDAMKPVLFWNQNCMKQGAAESKKEGNKEDNDVAKLVSKFDAKCDVKVTAQCKSQKSNVSFLRTCGNKWMPQ